MIMHPSLVLPWKFGSSVVSINAAAIPAWATHLFFTSGIDRNDPQICIVWTSGDTGTQRAEDAKPDSVHVHGKTQASWIHGLSKVNLSSDLWRCLGSRVPAVNQDDMRRVTIPRIGTDWNKSRQAEVTMGVDFESLEERAIASYQQTAKDPYKELAAKLFDVPTTEVTKEQRHIAKRGYYMIPYLQAEQSPAPVLEQVTAAVRKDETAHKRARIRELECAIRHNLNSGKDCPPALLVERNLLRKQVIELEKQS